MKLQDREETGLPAEYRSPVGLEKAPKRARLLARKHIIYEIAAVLCVIAVALYFIRGSSPEGAAPQGATPPFSSPQTGSGGAYQGNPQQGASLQILSVLVNNSTAKVSFKPVAGAKDYRIFDVAAPKVVKYAGMAHLEGGPFRMNADGTPVVPFQRGGNGPDTLDIPFPQIEWNLLEGGQPHTLIVQAVNQLGPIPPGNLYNDDNGPVTQQGSVSTIGMNEGPTPDGHISINGQGPPTNNPKVIAQSLPFIVQANPKLRVIPSLAGTTQAFFDTFDNSEAGAFKRTASDPGSSRATYSFNAGTESAWTIQYMNADVRDSYPFISAGHFMDVLFDGGTPGTNIPLHQEYAAMAMTPAPTVDLSSGKVLHVTMEVDLHGDSRRWTGIELTPANDPLVSPRGAINRSGKAFFFNYFPDGCTVDLYTGPGAGPDSDPNGTRLWGALGQAEHVCNLFDVYWGGNGVSLDNRGKVDLFFTQNHAALFVNGRLMIESDIPGGLPFTQARVYFTHYVYHTANDVDELQQYSPWETFWINYFHWSDERHWDNMGFEVFPASAAPNSAAWQKLVALPTPIVPEFAPTGTANSGTWNSATTSPALVADMPSRKAAGA